MGFHPDLHHRRSIRLPAWDYSWSAAYFVTMVTHEREQLFGEIVDSRIFLSAAGEICAQEWERSAELRSEVVLDAWVVMPNHLHGVVRLQQVEGSGGDGRTKLAGQQTGPRPRSLSSFVAGFKAAATKRINEFRQTPGAPVWQRSFYEHVIRNEQRLLAIREYIDLNPARWAEDRENPVRQR